MHKPIRVAFIGLNPDAHGAATAHPPALKALGDKFEIIGVANSSIESSCRTASALGRPHAFADIVERVASPEVDLVVVTVKAPHHLELVTAALDAGKHVYSEWPLGNGLEEARQPADLADQKGVVAVSGTQGRAAVEIEHLRGRIAGGYVGEVLSTTLIGSGGYWAGETIADLADLFDARNGASMQAISLAHTLAAVAEVLCALRPLTAAFVSPFDTVRITATGETRPKTIPDQIMAHGTLASGAAVSVHHRGGLMRGTNLLSEINGTEGDLRVTAASGHAQIAQLSIEGAHGADAKLSPLMPPASARDGWPESAMIRNVARIYPRLARDIEGACARHQRSATPLRSMRSSTRSSAPRRRTADFAAPPRSFSRMPCANATDKRQGT